KQLPGDFRARFHLSKMAHNLGLVQMKRGRAKDAAIWYEKSLELGAELLEKEPDQVELLGQQISSWRGRATLYNGANQPDKADEAYRNGEKHGDRLLAQAQLPAAVAHVVATTFSDHAAMVSNRGDPAKAKPLFLKALGIQDGLCKIQPEVPYLADLGI